jgi:hypothetical protein
LLDPLRFALESTGSARAICLLQVRRMRFQSDRFGLFAATRRVLFDRPLLAAGSTDRRNTLSEFLLWGLVLQGFTWSFF